MAKKRKTKAAAKKTAKKTKAQEEEVVDAVIDLRHLLVSKIASHGPAAVED